MDRIIFGGSNSRKLAKSIAHELGVAYFDLDVTHFPDGDSYVRLPIDVKDKVVVIVNSMHPNPNDVLVELVFAATTAKELRAPRSLGFSPEPPNFKNNQINYADKRKTSKNPCPRKTIACFFFISFLHIVIAIH